jgi:dTDP-glucose pyrophosphorylase
MLKIDDYIISIESSIEDALKKLNRLEFDLVLFIVDNENRLVGSFTDGDLRRGFIKGLNLENKLSEFLYLNPRFIEQGKFNLKEIVELRKQLINVFPVVDSQKKVVDVVNFRLQKSYLSVDAFIMAGGKGERLRPLTDKTPKPLLPIAGKPIIEHNVNRFINYGIKNIWISVNYLGDLIIQHFSDLYNEDIMISFVNEELPLGTAGALSLVNNFNNDFILLMNSDLLTNIDFEKFFLFLQDQDADFAVACIPYKVDIPFAVMNTVGNIVVGLREKPTFTHYSNAGIYLMRKEVLKYVPVKEKFNATDLMEKLIENGKKVVAYPLEDYWLDIGRYEDYQKAENDLPNLKL